MGALVLNYRPTRNRPEYWNAYGTQVLEDHRTDEPPNPVSLAPAVRVPLAVTIGKPAD